LGRARKDFVLRSHDAAKGEVLWGNQLLAKRDPEPPRGVRAREVRRRRQRQAAAAPPTGPMGRRPSSRRQGMNEQCAAKEVVVGTACMLLARPGTARRRQSGSGHHQAQALPALPTMGLTTTLSNG